MIYHAIVRLKKAHDCDMLSRRWFRKWWKNSNLHKIKTKPIAIERFGAGTTTEIKYWFDKYRDVLKALNIRKRLNIINFDESGFRIECSNDQEIIVFDDIKQFYAVSLENRKSMIIIETIDASDDYHLSKHDPQILIK